MDFFEKTVRDIKSLKIQGATNVAKEAVRAFRWKSGKINAKNKIEYLSKLEQIKKILCETRSTEPLMRNALRYTIHVLRESDLKQPKEMSKLIEMTVDEFFFNLKKAKEQITEIGARTIPSNSTIFTHCHSSTVVNILKKAKKDGKKFRVICTETRPLFQGRKTATELTKAKIHTTMVVDSAVSSIIKEADMAIVGADLISARGAMANKIGTKNLALACKRANIPLFSATLLAKLDPETIYGKTETIEQRNSKEIWDKPPRGLQILNPAFDITPREFINAYITEQGIVTPDAIVRTAEDNAPWMFRGIRL